MLTMQTDRVVAFGQTQFWTVFRGEMLHFSRDPIVFRAAVLLPFSILLAVWRYSGSPLIPAIVSALIILEPRFDNLLFTSPVEGEALSLFPVRWRAVIAAKNLATAALLFLLVPLLGIPIGFFGIAATDWPGAIMYLLTVVFPLLHLGNLHSLQHPRRTVGWSLGDLAEAIILLITAGVASIPFTVLSTLDSSFLWCSVYVAGGAWLWWRVSLPRAERILREGSVLARVEE